MHKLGTGLELWGGLFSFQVAVFARKVIIPLFYHLAVLEYKPCYSQEPWLALSVLVLIDWTFFLLFIKAYKLGAIKIGHLSLWVCDVNSVI